MTRLRAILIKVAFLPHLCNPLLASQVTGLEGEIYDMSPIRMSRVESVVRLVLAFAEAFNRHDVSGMMELVSEDCVFENAVPAPDGAMYSGKEALAQFFQALFSESPNARVDIEEIFGLGLRCVARWKYSWVDVTGVKGHVRGVGIFQERNGLIAEMLCYVKG